MGESPSERGFNVDKVTKQMRQVEVNAKVVK